MVRNYYWSQALKVQNLVIRWPRAGIYKNSHRDLSFWVARQSVDSTMVHPRSSPERKPDLWRQKWHHGESWLFVACFFTKKVKKVEVEAFWAPRLSKLQHPLPPHAHAHTHTHTHTHTYHDRVHVLTSLHWPWNKGKKPHRALSGQTMKSAGFKIFSLWFLPFSS